MPPSPPVVLPGHGNHGGEGHEEEEEEEEEEISHHHHDHHHHHDDDDGKEERSPQQPLPLPLLPQPPASRGEAPLSLSHTAAATAAAAAAAVTRAVPATANAATHEDHHQARPQERKLTQGGLIEVSGGRPTFSSGTAPVQDLAIMDRVKRAIEEASVRGASSLSLEELGIVNLPSDIAALSGSLEELNLERNALTSLPAEVGRLDLLDSLQLYSNQLTSLPPEMGQLHNLTRLFLNKNHLTSLPPEIVKLQSLVWLSLDHNKFTALPKEIGSLRALAWLSVEDNHLSTLPTELSQLSNLEYLSIYNNMQITALPLCMFSFKSLRCFRANQFFQVPKELLTGGTSVLIQHYLLELGRLEAQCDPASTTAHWVPDDTVDSCRHCSSAFSKLTRRHHCRLCGWVFCSKCTFKRLPIPQLYFSSPVRVCEACFDLLSASASYLPAAGAVSPPLSWSSSRQQ